MDASTAARLSQASYRMLEKGNKEERANRINDDIKDTGYIVDIGNSNRDILVLKDENNKKVHIAHRGTDTSGKRTKQDITADIMFGLGLAQHNTHFNKRKTRTQNVVKQYKDGNEISLSGHSYGGGSVKYALANSKAVRDNTKIAHTFNTASHPLPISAVRVGGKVKKDLDDKVIHHRHKDDVVSMGLKAVVPFGKVKEYGGKESLTKRLLKRHNPFFKTASDLDAHKLHHFIENNESSDF